MASRNIGSIGKNVLLLQVKFVQALCQVKRIWCSGIIVPSHGTDQGSIPWMRNKFNFLLNYLTLFCTFEKFEI
jgi:hypothetical protein